MVKFKQLVESHNGKANIWKQKNFIGEMTFGRDGFCSPLALKWIANRRIGINFKEDTALENGREEVVQLRLNQAKATGPKYLQEYLGSYGINHNLTVSSKGHVQLRDLDALLSEYYYFVVLSGTNGGHAVAIDMVNTNKFFDPNVGQASFENKISLCECFVEWCSRAYTSLNSEFYIFGFKP